MRLITATVLLLLATPALAAPALKPALAPVAFLVGTWVSGEGKVADTGGKSKGGSMMTVESDGSAILRRDHTETFDRAGKPAGSFHQTMLIYPDNGGLKADYVDGEQVDHFHQRGGTGAGVPPDLRSAVAGGAGDRLRHDPTGTK